MCKNIATEDETQCCGQNEPWTQDCQMTFQTLLLHVTFTKHKVSRYILT